MHPAASDKQVNLALMVVACAQMFFSLVTQSSSLRDERKERLRRRLVVRTPKLQFLCIPLGGGDGGIHISLRHTPVQNSKPINYFS